MPIDRQGSPYRRGNRFEVMPIPMVPDHCITVDAGAVQFVVESRRLTNEIIKDTYHGGREADLPFDDHGATLHVCGAADGLEYLRFDCFENEPHYHYIQQAAGANVVVRIDELAVGDPIEFLACATDHLPDMLRNCGVPELADEVAGQLDTVRSGVDAVRELMVKARQLVS